MDAMVTTIQISERLRDELKKRKLYAQESYEEIIWGLMEDAEELSEDALKAIGRAEADFVAGRFVSHETLKKKYGLR